MGNKNEKTKTYIVIGLAVVLGISFYFRFIHTKVKSDGDSTASAATPLQLTIPQIKIPNQKSIKEREIVVPEYLQTVIRDIFSPLDPLQKAKNEPVKQEIPEQPPPLKLKGTIVGGKRPIAIIDNQFVREGDWFGEYQVARIGKKDVLLNSGKRRIRLEMLKDE